MRGGVVQGIGGALFEHCTYSPEGQLTVGSMVDYLVPMAAEMPDIEVGHVETPTKESLLGAKGAGEAGTAGAPAAIMNAINDALRPHGAKVFAQPFTPERILAALGRVPSADRRLLTEDPMHELTPETITDAVLEQMATTSDPRLKEIMTAAVKHLHAFARDVNLTPAEWLKGIEFMTAVGKMCTAERQEFILLSDTLGLSALVNGLHDLTAVEDATQTSLLGPFFRENAPKLEAGAQIANKVTPGTEVALWGKVTNVRGEPLANAQVSVWQTGADGLYDIQVDASGTDYRGVFTADAQGNFLIRTVRPLGYSIPMDGPVGALVQAQRSPRHAAGPHPLPGQRAGLPRARDRALRAGRRTYCRRRRVRLVFGSGCRVAGERPGLSPERHSEHALRPEPFARERGR